ncbi:uncharacterized protein LOC112566417 isoform X2 [Pomacea canaliculata]|uniref:uncharacterized protein LOC112566417 isoform X2 n=1 Tax=Pomacea canaliculata TaxID=400727 RepID=UPI000D736E8D|nr:uncharacterized protein LOC112566417 isoform X2 [Pomacea canaliculata]
MSLDPDVSAIIGGCVGGGVVLVAIIALIVYFVCGCGGRGRRKRKKTFSQLSTSTSVQTSPSQSQPSSLGPGAEGVRLPKVSSSGLWVGSPSMYTCAPPPPVCLYGRYSSKQEAEHHSGSHLSSEKRTQKDGLVSPLFNNGEPSDLPQTSNSWPVIEVCRDTPAVYKFQDDGYPNGHLQRRHSDVNSGYLSPTADPKRSSKTRSATSNEAQVHDTQIKSTGIKGHTNLAFTPDMVHSEQATASAKEHHTMAVVTSATDSMKLLVKNKTDDQKQVVYALTPSFAQEPVVKADRFMHVDDVYSLPQKTDEQLETRARQSLDNPVLACMQAMGLDRTESEASPFGHTTGPMLRHEDLACTVPVIHNPLYEEADDVAASVHDVSATSQKADELPSYQKKHSASDQIQGSASDQIQGSASDQKQHSASVENESSKVMQAPISYSVFLELCAIKSEDTADSCDRVDDAISRQRQGSMDAEDGKHITAAAFQFLDNYLSDDESNDLHSPPTSPALSAHGNHSY